MTRQINNSTWRLYFRLLVEIFSAEYKINLKCHVNSRLKIFSTFYVIIYVLHTASNFCQFLVQSKCVHLLEWSQSAKSTFLPFFLFVGGSSFVPTNAAGTCINLFLWYRVPCNGPLPLSLIDYNNFSIWPTYIKLYYFVDAGSWRRNAVAPFNWFISSYSLN